MSSPPITVLISNLNLIIAKAQYLLENALTISMNDWDYQLRCLHLVITAIQISVSLRYQELTALKIAANARAARNQSS